MKNRKEQYIHLLFLVVSVSIIILLIGIFVLLISKSFPVFKELGLQDFFLEKYWNPEGWNAEKYGLLTMFYSSLIVTVGAMSFAIPLGIAVAAFLSDVASPRLTAWAKPLIEILAGIPSVVIGFLGIVFVGPQLSRLFNQANGLNALNGSLLLGIMALPTIISLSEDALNAVPLPRKQAAYALGSTRWQTIWRVNLPSALPGLVASSMLGMGRVIGETMTVLMATGCALSFPTGPFSSLRTMTSTIAIELGEVPQDTTHFYAIFFVGLCLFIVTFLINAISDVILLKYKDLYQT